MVSMFGFDRQFTMFDVTPVENQFILEDMPTAKGDHVKVYLYGLMQCHHPQEEMSLTEISRDLNMTEEEVLAAFRHWERKGLVQRVSDKPPAFRYVSATQRLVMGGAVQSDPAYEAFAESVYAVFGGERRLHGKEISLCYEWVEELGLPPEVVIMLLKHMMSLRGKNFSITAAQKLALLLAEEKAVTIDDAEMVLGREKAVWDGSRRVLRRLGKRREPSEDEMSLYLKWLRDWGYSADAIEAACAETTKGEPTFAYLDGILRGMKERRGRAMTSGSQVEKSLEEEKERVRPLKELLRAMNIREVSVNASTLGVYDDFRKIYPEDEIILLAGRECAKYGGKLESVGMMLNRWKRSGVTTSQEAEAYMRRFDAQNELIGRLYAVLGKPAKTSDANRALVQKWQEELGFSEDFIVFCAAFADKAEHQPMAYLGKKLEDYAARGIRTEEAAAAAEKAFREQQGARAGQEKGKAQATGRVLREQQYTQREYQPTETLPAWMKQRMEDKQDDE